MGASVRPVIRTSDRIQFKKCRRAWDISSKLRQNLEPLKFRPALDFGTAWHSAMEVWYNPETWSWTQDDRRLVVQELARVALHESLNKAYATCLPHVSDETELREEVQTYHQMGDGMLDYFFKYFSAAGKDVLTPVYVEIEFEVPIKWPDFGDRVLTNDWSVDSDNNLLYKGEVVVYQGRIDMIAIDRDGRYWIVDHKTAANLQPTTEFLELDEQMKSYVWGAKHQLGIDVKGVCYSEHRKGAPEPPKILDRPYRGRMISTNKTQQMTDLTLFLEALKETGESPELYEDYIHFLQNEGITYIRREFINYSEQELENLGKQIAFEAVDMLGDPFIYPSPDKFSCKWCDHRTLCMAMNDGSDTEYIKTNHYMSRNKNG